MDAINQITGPKSKTQQLGEILALFGLGSPYTRVIVAFIVGSGLSWLLQPRFAFDSAGARPLGLNSDDPRATKFPWYAPGIVLAVLFGIFF